MLGVLFFPKAAGAEGLNFTVTPIFPENQIDKQAAYFDLRVEPNEQQTIEVEISNKVDHEITVLTYATTVITNLNGIIEYKELAPTIDDSLKYPFTTIAEMPESVVLGANETKQIKTKITMPQEKYTGMILGGLYFKEKDDKEAAKDEQSGMGVRNVFSYVISVKLTESDDVLQPDLKLLSARAGEVNYHNAFEANLQNPEAVEMNDLSVTAQVVKEGSSKVLYEETKEGLRMAPNSNFFYPIALKGSAFQPGKYEMIVEAHTEDQEWSLKTRFEITGDQAKKLNDKSVEDLETSPRYWLWISVVVGIISIIIAVSVIWSRRKIKKMRAELDSQLYNQNKKEALHKGKRC